MLELINDWKVAKLELARLKKLEMELRLEVCEELLEGLEEGTHTFEEFGLKATKKYTISILQEELAEHTSSMSEDELACISFVPKLSLSLYKNLDNSYIIDECLISKPATPTLTVI